jgi:hypothetical protein
VKNHFVSRTGIPSGRSNNQSVVLGELVCKRALDRINIDWLRSVASELGGNHVRNGLGVSRGRSKEDSDSVELCLESETRRWLNCESKNSGEEKDYDRAHRRIEMSAHHLQFATL